MAKDLFVKLKEDRKSRIEQKHDLEDLTEGFEAKYTISTNSLIIKNASPEVIEYLKKSPDVSKFYDGEIPRSTLKRYKDQTDWGAAYAWNDKISSPESNLLDGPVEHEERLNITRAYLVILKDKSESKSLVELAGGRFNVRHFGSNGSTEDAYLIAPKYLTLVKELKSVLGTYAPAEKIPQKYIESFKDLGIKYFTTFWNNRSKPLSHENKR